LFQVLLLLQVPIVLVFALKWLPREPKATLIVLALQIGAACAAVGTIVFFEKLAGS
jgi:DMSO reductase anchor subunit